MKPHTKILTALIATSSLSGLIYLAGIRAGAQALAQQLPTHQTGEASNGGVVVELCDGVTKMEVKGLKPGQAMTHQQALAVTQSLMAEWARKHPNQHWEMARQRWRQRIERPEQLVSRGEQRAGRFASAGRACC